MSRVLGVLHADQILRGSGPVIDATARRFSGSLQAAANAARDAGGTLHFPGTTYATTDTLQVESSVTADPHALIEYTGTGTALLMRSGASGSGQTLEDLTLLMPRVRAMSKPTTGWSGTGAVGIAMVNVKSSYIAIRGVRDFVDGLLFVGDEQGCAYNDVHINKLSNNQRNIRFTADNVAGFVNQNTFVGGRLLHFSGEGDDVVGVSHIRFDSMTERPDGNNFLGVSLESPGVVEYHLSIETGTRNRWIGCRWENGFGGTTYWGNLAQNNRIMGGVGLNTMSFVRGGSSAVRNEVDESEFRNMGGTNSIAMMRLSNSASATAPVIRTYDRNELWDPAIDLAARWGWSWNNERLIGKAIASSTERISLQATTGRINTNGADILSGTGTPEGAVTAPQGSLFLRRDGGAGTVLYIKESGAGNTGWVAK